MVNWTIMKLAPALAAVVIIPTLAVACSRDALPTTPPSPDNSTAAVVLPEALDLPPLIKGPWSPDGLQAILGTGDLGVGTNRVGFVLTSTEGFVTTPVARVSAAYLGDGGSPDETTETATAEFRPWPYGVRGLYTTHLTFNRRGSWAINISVEDSNGSVQRAQLSFEVADTASAPPRGSAAVRSRSKTIADVETFAELTTGSLHDPDLYQTTIAEAIESGLPTVVVFASPAFCTNAVCGPQVEVLQELKNRYKGQANFIHVDFYDNPHEIQGDLDKARRSPTVQEWRLPSIEWTFVIDRRGIVSARFEAFATIDELDAALMGVM